MLSLFVCCGKKKKKKKNHSRNTILRDPHVLCSQKSNCTGAAKSFNPHHRLGLLQSKIEKRKGVGKNKMIFSFLCNKCGERREEKHRGSNLYRQATLFQYFFSKRTRKENRGGKPLWEKRKLTTTKLNLQCLTFWERVWGVPCQSDLRTLKKQGK